MKSSTSKQVTLLWIAIVALAVLLVTVYVSLTFTIQDTEKRLIETIHQQSVEIEKIKQGV